MNSNALEKMASICGNLKLPAIAAPMFLVSGPDLVLAVCKSGMIGALPFPNARTIDVLEGWLQRLTHEIDLDENAAPFAVNVTTHLSYDRLSAEVALLRKYKPKIVITALGGPEPVLEAVQSYGGIVIADVNSVKYARKAAHKGVDGLALIAAGAGGHTGSISGFAFVQEVRKFFDGIVVLAGSISTGEAVRAAEILGADFSYIGTSFVVATESLASDEYRNMLVRANFEDLVLSDALTGAKAYYLRASLEKMGFDPDNMAAGTGVDLANSQDQIKAWRDIWSAGHGVGAIDSVRPAQQIIDALKTGYDLAVAKPGFCKRSIGDENE